MYYLYAISYFIFAEYLRLRFGLFLELNLTDLWYLHFIKLLI